MLQVPGCAHGRRPAVELQHLCNREEGPTATSLSEVPQEDQLDEGAAYCLLPLLH